MLNIENAIRIEHVRVVNGRGQESLGVVYIFRCRDCSSEIRSRKHELASHAGRCRKCASRFRAPVRSAQHCLDCGVDIRARKAGRCRKCASRINGKHLTSLAMERLLSKHHVVEDFRKTEKQLYAFNCSRCGAEIKTRLCRLGSHTGLCRSCSSREHFTPPDNTTHGMSKTPEYRSYQDAWNRCNNPRVRNYAAYGGRGIKFLFTSFEQYYAEIGPRPKGKLPSGKALYSVDRINNDGNYEPGNVRWSTYNEQMRNRRQWKNHPATAQMPVAA